MRTILNMVERSNSYVKVVDNRWAHNCRHVELMGYIDESVMLQVFSFVL